MKSVIVFFLGVCSALAAENGGCLFDGRVYGAGDTFIIQPCLAQMTCLGSNLYSSKSLGGQCPDSKRAADDGQSGCLFDGHVYNAGDTFIIQPCLAQMTCLGHNTYSSKSLGGVCPDAKREVDGQTGCLFDGKVYAAGEKVIIEPCLAEMTCLGQNSYSQLKQLYGQC